MKKILIAAPLDSELKPVLCGLQRQKLPFAIYSLVLGVGPKKSVKNLSEFLKREPTWDMILVVGLAGALTSELKTGDVVAASSAASGAEKMYLEDIASTYKNIASVPFITTNRILKTAEKAELVKQDPEAKVVDMESFGIAKYLKEGGYKFQIIRAILDEHDYVFPDFRWVFSQKSQVTVTEGLPAGQAGDSHQDFLPFLGYLITRPMAAHRVLAFRRKLKKALNKLAIAVCDILNAQTTLVAK